MTSITPDIAGFVTAQNDLRTNFGSAVTFLIPVVPEWPVGTAINPDTNRPYDAMVVRTNEADTEVEKTCLIIVKQGSPLRPQSDVRFEAGGEFENMDIILDISAADYADVEDATDFRYQGKTFNVEEAKPFSMASSTYRYLIYGAEH